MAYKARAPDIIISDEPGRYSVFSMRTGELLQSGALEPGPDDERPCVQYLELDSRRIYMATSRGMLIKARDAAGTLLHAIRSTMLPLDEVRYFANFIGCHVDLRGRFCAMICYRGDTEGGLLIHDLSDHTQTILLDIEPIPMHVSVEVCAARLTS